MRTGRFGQGGENILVYPSSSSSGILPLLGKEPAKSQKLTNIHLSVSFFCVYPGFYDLIKPDFITFPLVRHFLITNQRNWLSVMFFQFQNSLSALFLWGWKFVNRIIFVPFKMLGLTVFPSWLKPCQYHIPISQVMCNVLPGSMIYAPPFCKKSRTSLILVLKYLMTWNG